MDANISDFISQMSNLAMHYGVKFLFAIAIFIVGKYLARMLSNSVGKTMSAKVDETVSQFTKNILYYALLTIIIIAALGQLGVQTASFVAIIGAAGLAVGFALQGSLSNFASGVLLILFRPFKVGDYVEAGGAAGVVKEISIFSTILLTVDNKTVIIANASVTGGNIINYSAQEERRVDLTVGVSYNADISLVKQKLQDIASQETRILPARGVTIAVAELADSSVNFVFRVWVKTPDYWDVFFELTEQVKRRFDEANIEIPFPQMDVHLSQPAA